MIAFLGTGLLGAGFVRALIAQGETVHVWNRSPDKARALEQYGARAFDDSADLRQSLEDVIQTGAGRILTSGGAVTALAGAALLGERLTPLAWAGAALIMAAVVLVQWGGGRKHQPKRAEPAAGAISSGRPADTPFS